MIKAYKYRIYPTEAQKELLAKHFGCVRYVYNWGLATKVEEYQNNNHSVSKYELMKNLTHKKKLEETKWLTEVNSQSLQASLENLDAAYKRFFKQKKGFPKFKNKFSRQSFKVKQGLKFDFNNNRIRIPKFREGIKIKLSRTFTGTIISGTVSKSTTNNYYVSVVVETGEPTPKKKQDVISEAIGIDLGIKDFATLSTGEVLANPKFLRKGIKRLKVLQRRVSKKKKGSNNRRKANLKVAKLHEKIANQRLDFLHKLSTRLVSENQTICIEDLHVAGMIKNHKLAQAISDVSWSKFRSLLEYKCEWYGCNLRVIGRFAPSSKLCTCGVKNDDLTLSDRLWTCSSCGETHERDVLAANNIKRFAFHPYNKKSGSDRPVELGEMSTLVESMTQ